MIILLGKDLKLFRKKLKISQQELAVRLGVSLPTIYRAEKDGDSPLSKQLRKKISLINQESLSKEEPALSDKELNELVKIGGEGSDPVKIKLVETIKSLNEINKRLRTKLKSIK